MDKILITHASTGSGHKTAAESIALACQDICRYDIKEDVAIEVIDLLDFCIKKIDGNKMANSYTGKMAPLHDVTWRFNFTGRINWGGNYILSETLFRKFKTKLKEINPKLVICTHMMAANVVAGIRMKSDLCFPIVSVPTDYETEGLWPHQESDLFCVASDSMIQTLSARKVPYEKILLTGLPVAPAFTKQYNKIKAKENNNLPKDKQIALILAGASESKPYVNLRKSLNHVIQYFVEMDWMHFIFCTGKDEDYKKQLLKKCDKYNANNITIFGYKKNMAELMAASDIALCKAGGLTVTECICAKLPMLIIGKGYAQEHINVRYLTGIGVAYRATTYKEIIDRLCHITSSEVVKKALLENINNIRREAAAYDISRAGLQLAGFNIDGQVEHAKELYENKKHRKTLFGFYIGNSPAHSR